MKHLRELYPILLIFLLLFFSKFEVMLVTQILINTRVNEKSNTDLDSC